MSALEQKGKPMLDHVSLGVNDLELSRRFYDAVLEPIGLVRFSDFEGRGTDYDLYTSAERTYGCVFTITREDNVKPSNGHHICFSARTRGDVVRFYEAALANGGRDDGTPGLRPIYHENYFAAFVLDPDGHRIEAVCHDGGTTGDV
jgi:catechol 2,3-dioxygenase-like lactoylglutathione lyase family enzyme